MAPLNYVYQHPQAVSGIVIVLICATAILLLIRALGQKNETTAATAKVEATIDVDTIEGAMKRVLASQGPVAAVAAAPTVIDGGDSEAMNAALREREARIAELQTEIAKLRADLENAPAVSAGGGATTMVEDPRVGELQAKLEELKGRLQEYEIIEDDIADLSLYKDENARLKHEIKRLREEFPEAATAVPTQEQQEANAEVARAEAVVAAEQQPAPAPEPEPAADDDVMKQFAAAVQVQKAPPPEADLKVEANPFGVASPEAAPESAAASESADDPFAFELDPEKIMNEVSTLSESDDVTSALEESLDTDKLLAEVGSLQGAPEAAPAPAAAAAAPTPAPVPPAADIKSFDPLAPDMPAVDDLLAEFKETKS